MLRTRARHTLSFIFSFLALSCFGQRTIIEGRVIERGSNEAVVFANIHLKGTSIGAVTDTLGQFTFDIANEKVLSDSLIVSHLIFDKKSVFIKKGEAQKLTIYLDGNLLFLEGVTITPGENPAFRILRKVNEQKGKNNPDRLRSYQRQAYAKTRFDLNHFTNKIKNNILVRPFDYIWDNVDTTEDGVTYLPLLMTEKIIREYHQSSPAARRDSVIAINQVGLPGKKMLEFTEDLYLSPNMYDDFVVLLDKNFASPLHQRFEDFYRYYLLDTMLNDEKVYHIAFRPKSKIGLAFNGEMFIDGESYALRDVKVQFDVQANVNFVRSYLVSQTYSFLDNQQWMLTKSSIIGDFTVMENVSEMTGFFGRNQTYYSDYKINEELPSNIFEGSEIVVEALAAQQRDTTFWSKNRSESLSKDDENVFEMIHRLEADPKFTFRKNLIRSVVTGYIPAGHLEIGQIYQFYSRNSVEGDRFKFGLRSNQRQFNSFEGSAYLAYGIRDERFKYGLDLAQRFGTKKKSLVGFSHRNDLIQFGRSFNQMPLDHIFSSFVSLDQRDVALHYETKSNFVFEREIRKGLVAGLGIEIDKIAPTADSVFYVQDDNGVLNSVDHWNTTELAFNVKYSWQADKLRASFYNRQDLKKRFNPAPDISLQIKHSNASLSSDFDYTIIKLGLRQSIRTKKLGYFYYSAEVGSIMGSVPYTKLHIPFSNPLVFLDDEAFNLMNHMEYASEQYIQLSLQQHFDGYFFNRLPLLKKLKWRSFIFGKVYFGQLSEKNNASTYLFPEGLNELEQPYYEVGFGIENIFKIARMDFIWRLTDTDKDNVYKFLIKPSFSLSF